MELSLSLKHRFLCSGFRALQNIRNYDFAGIKGDPADARAPLDTPITFVAKTPDMSLVFRLIVRKVYFGSDPVIPVTVTNLDEFDISLHRIDLASMASYRMLFQPIETSDLID